MGCGCGKGSRRRKNTKSKSIRQQNIERRIRKQNRLVVLSGNKKKSK